MTTVPCIILGGVISTIATLLLVEDEINYPVGGSGAGTRRAEKRAAEAADGASILKGASEADQFHTLVNRVRLSALHPTSTGLVVQTAPAKRSVTGFVSKQIEKCRKALAARVTTSPIGQSSVTASGQCPPVVSFSAGEQFSADVQAALFGLLHDGIISETEYNESAALIRHSLSGAMRCLVPDSDQPAS